MVFEPSRERKSFLHFGAIYFRKIALYCSGELLVFIKTTRTLNHAFYLVNVIDICTTLSLYLYLLKVCKNERKFDKAQSLYHSSYRNSSQSVSLQLYTKLIIM